MNFTAYVQRQKDLIRSRHSGETYLTVANRTFNISETEKIFYELDSLKGLNKRERMQYSSARWKRGENPAPAI